MQAVFDESLRSYDSNGFLHVSQSNLTKEEVAGYYGREIPGWKSLGLEENKVYGVYRPGDELEKSASTFNGIPVLIRHKQDTAFEPQKALRIGATGTNAAFDGVYLTNAITFHDASAIALITDGVRSQLSAGYFYTPVSEEGVFDGKPYQIKMTAIKANHIALVEEGRAGPDVSVADEMSHGKTPCKSSVCSPGTAIFNVNKESAARRKNYPVLKRILGLIRQNTGETAIEKTAIEKEAMEKEASTQKEDSTLDNLNSSCVPKVNISPNASVHTSVDCIGDRPENKIAGIDVSQGDGNTSGSTGNGIYTDYKYKQCLCGKSSVHEPYAEDGVALKYHMKEEAAEFVRFITGNIRQSAFDSAEEIYSFALRRLGVEPEKYPVSAYKGILEGVGEYYKAGGMYQPTADYKAVKDSFAGSKHLNGVELSRFKRG